MAPKFLPLSPMPLRWCVLRPLAAFASAASAWIVAGSALAQPALPKPEVLVSGLANPWAIAPLPDERWLLSERAGKLWLLNAQGTKQTELKGVPAVAFSGQGGLLDVVADSQFASNRRIYFCYSEPGQDKDTNSTALASARVAADERQLEDVKRIFSQSPKVKSSAHFGCRIADRNIHRDCHCSTFRRRRGTSAARRNLCYGDADGPQWLYRHTIDNGGRQ